jgi:hypothetical protein
MPTFNRALSNLRRIHLSIQRCLSGSYSEIAGKVHVVSYDHLDEYVGIVNKQYSRKADYIEANQQKIKTE